MRHMGRYIYEMRWSALTMILATSLGFALSHCPDPKLRRATIRGDTVRGVVTLHKKPFKLSHVRLLFSSGKAAWAGATDDNGRFTTSRMPPGDYVLEVSGWGRTTVQVNPETDLGIGGKTPEWFLILSDNSCVVTAIFWD